jgi:hypothetical protein
MGSGSGWVGTRMVGDGGAVDPRVGCGVMQRIEMSGDDPMPAGVVSP